MPKFYRSVYSSVANIPASVLREESKKEGNTAKNASEREIKRNSITSARFFFFFFRNFRSVARLFLPTERKREEKRWCNAARIRKEIFAKRRVVRQVARYSRHVCRIASLVGWEGTTSTLISAGRWRRKGVRNGALLELSASSPWSVSFAVLQQPTVRSFEPNFHRGEKLKISLSKENMCRGKERNRSIAMCTADHRKRRKKDKR